MKIAIIGYGKMGKAIESIALERNHSILAKIDLNEDQSVLSDIADLVDVVIEFTNPQSAKNNILKFLNMGLPVVSGSTGWDFKKEEFEIICENKKTALFYASNFSVGVNIFMDINIKLARIMSRFDDYSVKMNETHHIHKLDKPSGTAISLAEQIIDNCDKYNNWELEKKDAESSIEIDSYRKDEVIGDHQIVWDSEIDSISISHSAKSRKGFALGAVLAAEYVVGKKGVLNMKDLLNL